MSTTITVELKSPASEMAQEEILKQVAFLSKGVSNHRFAGGGAVLQFDAPPAEAEGLRAAAGELATKIQRGLRSLQRKVRHRTPAADRPVFRGAGKSAEGVHFLGVGQVALHGMPLKLFRYFDREFEAFGRPYQAEPVMTPTLIPSTALAKCDYFRSFPNNVTFACHMLEEPARVTDFRARHQDRDELDDKALSDMQTPEACLSPAVCYHVYHLNKGKTLPAEGVTYGICGKCFRYESSNMADLRRLWDFTMREVVFLGGRDPVLADREKSIAQMAALMDEWELAGEIRTASDPFFIAPDAVSKAYFQLSSETKYEISLMLPDDARLAVGSHNYHTDFFGRAFDVTVEGHGPMHSVCVAFGLERWVYAFLQQHGHDPAGWPARVRSAPEFRDGAA